MVLPRRLQRNMPLSVVLSLGITCGGSTRHVIPGTPLVSRQSALNRKNLRLWWSWREISRPQRSLGFLRSLVSTGRLGLLKTTVRQAWGMGSEVQPLVSLYAAAPGRSSKIPRGPPGPRSDPFLAGAVEESSTCGTRHLAEPRSEYRSPAVVLRRMSAIG